MASIVATTTRVFALNAGGRLSSSASCLTALPFVSSLADRRSAVPSLLALRVQAEQTGAPAPTPASQRKFTGYVEKDTAGQENVYAVEPNVYVADSAISTNSNNSDTVGSGGTLLISGLLAVAVLAAAALVLFSTSTQAAGGDEVYNGPPLNFYIQKFKGAVVAPSLELEESSVSAPAVEE